MPKTKIDYGNTTIYKISCKDSKVKDVYVGYTTNFIQRKYFHKNNCINHEATNYDDRLYAVIRKHGGWENWKMENIHVCNCEDYNAAKKIVQEYAVTLRATLNSVDSIPCNSLLPTMVMEPTEVCKKMKNKTKNPKNPLTFLCDICDYITSNKKDYNKHINTIKHINNQKSPEHNMVCECGKTYTNRASLFNHRKVCPMTCKDGHNHGEGVSEKVVKGKGEDNLVLQIQEGEKGEKGENDENIKITKDMFFKLVNDNQEMIKIIKEQQQQINLIIPKISNAGSTTTNNNTTMNNTNNNFNLNFFLNEKCKDALNMSEFIESLKITLEDLQYSRSNGLVQGISNVMIRGLKELDIYKRPIHCTDVKRDTMYIKDKEKWEKDEKHEKMKNTIIKIANKERNAISAWVDINPDWFDTEEKQMEYLTLVNKVCEPIENDIKNEKKIIKNIGKEIVLNKETEKQLMLKLK
jgi:hypothetical protein